jgi:hypothetical protein
MPKIGRDIVMNITHRSPSQNRPGVVTILAFLLPFQGIEDLVAGAWTAITGKPLSFFGAIPISAIDYPLHLVPSHIAQIIFSCLIGILFFVLSWGLSTLKPWAYWIALVILLPSWMIYDLSKTFLLLFHTLPPTLFENSDISSNAGSFIIELVLFLLIVRGNVRRSFYPSEVNMIREDRRERI